MVTSLEKKKKKEKKKGLSCTKVYWAEDKTEVSFEYDSKMWFLSGLARYSKFPTGH